MVEHDTFSLRLTLALPIKQEEIGPRIFGSAQLYFYGLLQALHNCEGPFGSNSIPESIILVFQFLRNNTFFL